MRKLPSGIYILALAQVINLTTAVISATIAPSTGSILSNNKSLGTLPYGLQFLALLIFTYPVTSLMQIIGRKNAFYIGGGLLFFAGITGFLAIEKKSFNLLCISHFILGAYFSIANFYRFAATDSVAGKQKDSAISLVVAGGVLAALLGPFVASQLKTFHGYRDFSLCYAFMSLTSLFTIILIHSFNKCPAQHQDSINKAIATDKLNVACIAIAIATSSWGYLAMNLLMVQASLVLQGICTFDKISTAIQAHVLAMFLPSFFASYLMKKTGQLMVVAVGCVLLCVACAASVAYSGYASIYWSLIVVGISWNLMYVGGGALLAKHISANNQLKLQGINDTAIAFFAAIGAFSSAPLLLTLGWHHTNAIVFFISLLIASCTVVLLFVSRNNEPKESFL